MLLSGRGQGKVELTPPPTPKRKKVTCNVTIASIIILLIVYKDEIPIIIASTLHSHPTLHTHRTTDCKFRTRHVKSNIGKEANLRSKPCTVNNI